MKLVWFSWFSVFVCALSLTLFAYTSYQRSGDRAAIEKLAIETNAALCALRADLQRRHDAGVAFLKENPNGIPGISAADIQRSLGNQQATLDALSDLSCS